MKTWVEPKSPSGRSLKDSLAEFPGKGASRSKKDEDFEQAILRRYITGDTRGTGLTDTLASSPASPSREKHRANETPPKADKPKADKPSDKYKKKDDKPVDKPVKSVYAQHEHAPRKNPFGRSCVGQLGGLALAAEDVSTGRLVGKRRGKGGEADSTAS
jgi:cell division septation protein DedD